MQICQMIMLNDHWMGYIHPEPMSLEDGMSIAFVLNEAGVNVEEMLEIMDEFQPLQGTFARVGIPLCWLTDPMDHVQDLLNMMDDLPNMEPELVEQMQQTLEEMLGETPEEKEEWPEVFRTMSINTVQWLLDLTEILSDDGRLALRAWWQGRLITLLRAQVASSRKRTRRRRAKNQPEVPSAFRDLIQSLDMADIEAEDHDDEDHKRPPRNKKLPQALPTHAPVSSVHRVHAG